MDRFFLMHDDPSVVVSTKGNDGSVTTQDLNLLTSDLIREWVPSRLPDTGEHVVKYLKYALKKIGQEGIFDVHYIDPDLIRFEPKAGHSFCLMRDFDRFLHYEGPNPIAPAESTLTWWYQKVEQKALAFYTKKFLFVSCYENILLIAPTKVQTVKNLLGLNRVIDTFTEPDVRVQSGGAFETDMTFITEANLLEWSHSKKNLPMQA